ncbi:hypothetical protein C0995_000235 [Termitomyces sp. Mi166|nr:hypothetical protein C0995_000235 [Termitomyces sp. Mi166\
MTIMFKAKDPQLAANFFLKSRSTLTIKEVVNEDCLKPLNSESIHQPILMDLKRRKSVSTPPNPPSPQANPIPSHATSSEQPPQPGDNTAQPQNNVILLFTPSPTFLKPNIAFPKPSPELLNNLDIRIIGAAPFAQIMGGCTSLPAPHLTLSTQRALIG